MLKNIYLTYKENNYGYNNPNKTNDLDFLKLLPTELILNGSIIVSFRFNQNSSFEVRQIESKLQLYSGNEYVCDITFSKRPLFWNMRSESGIPMKRIGSVYGTSTLTFFLMNYCEFFKDNNECRFCSLEDTYDNIKSVEFVKKTDDILSVIRAAQSEHYKFINFIGGSLYNSDREFEAYIKCIEQICNELKLKEINGYVVSQPPRNKKLLNELRSAGINGVKFNLEVTNAEKFEKLCPGKSLFGYENIEQKLLEAVEVFGKNHVYTNFILGLEPLDTVIERVERLAKYHVGVVPHIFHGDVGSQISAIPMDVEEVYQVYCEFDKINKKYGIIPWLDKSSSRGCLSWDLYERSK